METFGNQKQIELQASQIASVLSSLSTWVRQLLGLLIGPPSRSVSGQSEFKENVCCH